MNSGGAVYRSERDVGNLDLGVGAGDVFAGGGEKMLDSSSSSSTLAVLASEQVDGCLRSGDVPDGTSTTTHSSVPSLLLSLSPSPSIDCAGIF